MRYALLLNKKQAHRSGQISDFFLQYHYTDDLYSKMFQTLSQLKNLISAVCTSLADFGTFIATKG